MKNKAGKWSRTGHRYRLANRQALAADAGGLETYLVSARLGEGNLWILLGGSLPIAESPIPLGRVACALIGELYRKAVRLEAKVGERSRTGYFNILADLVAGTANAGSGKTNLVSARLGEGNLRILLIGGLPVAKSPVPLRGISCGLVGKLNRQSIVLIKKIGKRRCTIQVYGLANRKALAAYTRCLKANLVSAWLRERD